MKNTAETQVFMTALHNANRPAGTVLATFQIDLPMSNGRVCLCAYVQPLRQHPVAVLQSPEADWTWMSPSTPMHWMLVPTHVYKFLMRTLHSYGIIELIGIDPEDHQTTGVPLL